MTPWIKMRTNLANDPRVALIAKKVHCNAVSVIGGLYILWSLGDEYSVDGRLVGYDASDLDKKFGKEGFATALASPQVGWLEIGDNCLIIPRFSEHNGESAKARAQTAKRVREHRKRNAKSVTKALTDEDEERDEDKKKEAAPLVDEIDGDGNVITAEVVYRAYPKQVEPEPSKKAISEAVRYLRKQNTPNPWAWLLGRVQMYADARSTLNTQSPGSNQFIPACHRWMRKKRYEEEPQIWLEFAKGSNANGHRKPKSDDRTIHEDLKVNA